MSQSDPVAIIGMARTPMGGLQGDFASLAAPRLGSVAIEAAVRRAGLAPGEIEEVVMGCVLAAGQGQAPARQAALGAGLPESVPCTTINKMCGSGMQAVMFAHDLIRAGSNKTMVAGGMESMSNAPYLLARARSGYRLCHDRLIDHMFLDGLEDAYDKGRLMGTFAEDAAQAYQFSRVQQDDYALSSLSRALQAEKNSSFADEIAEVAIKDRKGNHKIVTDEQPGKASPEKIPTLKPAFREGGTVTAANSSSISDGAAALTLMQKSEADRRGLKSLATIAGHAKFAHAPAHFATAPVSAIRLLLEKIGWRVDDVDLWEINEAFAVVAMIAMRDLGLPHEKVNIHGGACALGHPIGASGARIIVTLLSAMRQKGLKKGIAAVCIGGGEATAVALEITG